MTRQALVVLGMHRSGTSALTRTLSLLGAELPASLMATHDDNPKGYWESQRIARFNNLLLASAGLRWDSDGPISKAWFSDESAREHQFEDAIALIAEEFRESPLIVFKDPRLCRLFPFWERVLATAGIQPKVVMCLRKPSEVARSLALRYEDPRLHPAAIRSRSRAVLLWLRHVLDAERSTRHLPRVAVHYEGLLQDWRHELRGIPNLIPALNLPDPMDPNGQQIDRFLDPALRRHSALRGSDDSGEGSGLVMATMEALAHARAEVFSSRLDALSRDLDRLVSTYAPVRSAVDRLAMDDLWSDRVLEELEALHAPPWRPVPAGARKPTVLFVSRTAESRAHHYRVLHSVDQLRARGWSADWRAANDPELLGSIGDADAVVVSRGPWGRDFEKISQACVEKGAPLICDVDDLTFEPEVLAAGLVEHFNELHGDGQAAFMSEAQDLRSALASCSAVFATTAPLARAAARHAPRTFVLPNCFGGAMLTAAAASRSSPKPSALDGSIRVGFASGTPTHNADFATIAGSVADFLEANPRARLVVLGYLDVSRFPELARHRDQIECRPAVPLEHLSTELARFDINLAPLEIDNPFCEAKSEIRFTSASALAIPTVAVANEPMGTAVIDGVTGFLARTPTQWRQRIQELAADPALRHRLGEASCADTRARFGPEKTGVLLERFLTTVLALHASTCNSAGASPADD